MTDPSRSHSLSFHTREADFRAVFVSIADAVNAASKQIRVDDQMFYHFSEFAVCTNLLAAHFRDVEDLTLELTTHKLIQNLIVEASPNGVFRAACRPTPYIKKIKSTDEIDEDIFGGTLRAFKRYAKIGEPSMSMIGSESKSIPNLVQQYLHESEQIATLMLTGIKLRPGNSGGVLAEKCFGLLIEALPEVSEEKKFILTDNLERLSSLTEYFDLTPGTIGEPHKDVMDLLDDIYPGEQWTHTDETAIVYRCRCHREGYLTRLVELARRDISELFGDLQELEVRCGYCSNVFNFPRAEIESKI